MLDIDIILSLKVGDIILDAGKTDLSTIIKDFQIIKDKAKGIFTHAMTVEEIIENKVCVSEAIDENVVGSPCITDFQTYLDSGNSLLLLRYKNEDVSKASIYHQLAIYYDGRSHYDFWGLFQQIWKFTKLYLNKNFIFHCKNTTKRFMCGSLAAFYKYYIYNDSFFANWTALAPVDLACSDLFELKIINRS